MSISETYLERFIENVGTIPQEIRRNLAQMRSLDQTYLSLQQHLRDSENDYLKRSHDIIHSYTVASKSNLKKNKNKRIKTRHDDDDDNDAAAAAAAAVMNTTTDGDGDGTAANANADTNASTNSGNETNGDTADADHNNNNEQDENMSTSASTSSQESELDEAFFQIKHHEGILVQPLQLDSAINHTNTNTQPSAPSQEEEEDKETVNEIDDQAQNDQHDNNNNDNPDAKHQSTTSTTRTPLIVPTTEELRQQIQDPYALLQIATLRKTAREMVEEKLSNAHQTHSIIQDAIQRLDSDIQEFEDMLKTTGQYELLVASSAAAAAPTSGGVGMGGSNNNSNARNSHGHGTIRVGPQKDDLAAIQVMPNSPDWILAKVISHDTQSGMYNLSDEDIESNKTFLLPEAQVVILGGVDRLNRAEVIYGVYPDTTSFYQATVVEMPKRIPGKDPLVLVHFKDDGDEHGITHAKAVPMKHVMKVPYGAIK